MSTRDLFPKGKTPSLPPSRPRRTCLSMPASNMRMLQKGATLNVDECFLDLEDSVAPKAKEQARDNAVEALNTVDYGDKTVVVRVNAVKSEWFLRDVETLITKGGDQFSAIMIPKVDSADEIIYAHYLISALEDEINRNERLGLEVLIESALALKNVDEIVSASDRIETLVYGPGDMAASLGMPSLIQGDRPDGYNGDPFHYPLMRMLCAARAKGVQAIDGPFATIKDLAGLKKTATMSAALGFDGKWVIHPDQVDIVNAAFTPEKETFLSALAMLGQYKDSLDKELIGAVMVGTTMVDEASAKMAQRIVERGLAAGLAP